MNYNNQTLEVGLFNDVKVWKLFKPSVRSGPEPSGFERENTCTHTQEYAGEQL